MVPLLPLIDYLLLLSSGVKQWVTSTTEEKIGAGIFNLKSEKIGIRPCPSNAYVSFSDRISSSLFVQSST